MIYAVSQTSIFADIGTQRVSDSPSSPIKPGAAAIYGSKTPLLILTAAAVVAVYDSSGTNTVISLGLSYATLFALALLVTERASAEARESHSGGSVIYSANGFLSQPDKPASSPEDASLSVIRDVSAAAALGTLLAALTLESFTFGGVEYYGLIDQAFGSQWVFWQAILSVLYWVFMVGVHMAMYATFLLMVSTPPRNPLCNDIFLVCKCKHTPCTRVMVSAVSASKRATIGDLQSVQANGSRDTG